GGRGRSRAQCPQDPAGGVPGGDQRLSLKATDPERISFIAPDQAKIVVRRALWGPVGENLELTKRQKDVTAQVQRMVGSGATDFTVAELAAEGDPAPNTVKTLRVEYEVGGQVRNTSATDPESVAFEFPADAAPPATVERTPTGALIGTALEPGDYRATLQSGRILHFGSVAPRAHAVAGPWELHFPAGWGAPDHVRLARLLSWGDHPEPGVRYFSGTAIYHTTFNVPRDLLGAEERVTLDLGEVQVMARPNLNGHDLGLLWRPPYRVDVTGALRAGSNTLEVQVTNLWPNRLIGDEQLPEDSERNTNGTLRAWPPWLLAGKPSPTGRVTFTSWRLWGRDDPLLPSGLLGPVRLECVTTVPLG
ncbi:MAG: glycosylhydrolase-like jelly roll fold domain-containing protein, partial [Armatimonadota bacterium]